MNKIFDYPMKKVNGMMPYLVEVAGKEKYLFAVNENTSYRKILKIYDRFNTSEFVFALTGMHNRQLMDAADAFQSVTKEGKEVYIQINDSFYKAEIIEEQKDDLYETHPDNFSLKLKMAPTKISAVQDV